MVEDLRHKNSRGFGSMAIHSMLLLKQFDACLELEPSLLKRRKASLLVRPSFTINGTPAPVGMLGNSALVITSTDHDQAR